ncbi:DUF4232 domain-containing protein [Streptomyces sp. NPDC059378]|uniref:DUF4232 domain-containing protein n=1 Tax=Streptomyces sp. NPDC059378 TaxID=3346815 RepID=UPI0036C04E7E
MRVHQLTFAALAVAAGLSLTACQSGADGTGQSTSSSASATSSATGGATAGGSTAGGSDQDGGKDSAGQGTAGTGSTGQGTAAGSSSGSGSGSGSDAGGTATGRCRTADLEITAKDRTIDGDPDGTVVVELKNRGSRDCTLSGYAGVDLKTNAGSLSAQRTGDPAPSAVLKSGRSTAFGISYPLNTSGGSGVRITGLLVTPPNETRTVTLTWPGAGSLPVTEGGGMPVKVGPIGSAGQGG